MNNWYWLGAGPLTGGYRTGVQIQLLVPPRPGRFVTAACSCSFTCCYQSPEVKGQKNITWSSGKWVIGFLMSMKTLYLYLPKILTMINSYQIWIAPTDYDQLAKRSSGSGGGLIIFHLFPFDQFAFLQLLYPPRKIFKQAGQQLD